MFFWNFVLILVLIALNGFFVAVEFAAVASRRSKLDLMDSSGKSRAIEIVHNWLDNPPARDKLIAAAQLGITIVSLALGAVGENTFEAILEPVFAEMSLPNTLTFLSPVIVVLPLVFSLIIITSMHVVLGEQVPKVASLHAPERIAIFGARPMHVFSTIFRWFVNLLDWATRMILSLFGLKPVGGHSVMYTLEELKLIVTESEEVGVIEGTEREMLHAIFDFGDLFARQVMIPRTEIIAFEAEDPLQDCIDSAIQSTFTKFPVYAEDLDTIVGIVHIKEMLRARVDPEKRNSKIKDLAHEAIFVPETASVRDLLADFRQYRQHIAIVLDEFAGTAGLVTLEDIMEEIVGEVSDPFDAVQPEIDEISKNKALIDGLVLVETVNEDLELHLIEPHYDTIAGYILGQLNRMPRIGDIVETDQVRLTVEELDGMRISKVLLEKLAPSNSAREQE